MILIAAIVQLEAIQAGRIEQDTGRGVHGFFFNHWQRVNPEIGDHLHEDNQVAPYTLSPLMGLHWRRGAAEVQPGDKAWLRVTTLSERISQALLTDWLPGLPHQLEIEDLSWTVRGWTIDPEEHQWAGQTTNDQLSSQYLYSIKPPVKWRLCFETPTTFNSGIGHMPFPLPDSLVRSWLRRWQVFSPVGLPDELPELVRVGVVVSAYDLKTLAVRAGLRLTVGCRGYLSMRALKQPPSTRAPLDLLANYAFYCGSGHRTTQGMGLTMKL